MFSELKVKPRFLVVYRGITQKADFYLKINAEKLYKYSLNSAHRIQKEIIFRTLERISQDIIGVDQCNEYELEFFEIQEIVKSFDRNIGETVPIYQDSGNEKSNAIRWITSILRDIRCIEEDCLSRQRLFY